MKLSRRTAQFAENHMSSDERRSMKGDYRRIWRSSYSIARQRAAFGKEISVGIDELRPLVQGEPHSAAALMAWREDVPLPRK